MYQYILFDLDGTLTDPGEGITNSVDYALKKYNIIIEDKKELYKFIGPPLQESFQKYYGFSTEQSLQAVEFYREYFRDKGIFENEVYNGTAETLSVLKNKGKHIILATSKPERFARQILAHFDLMRYFDFVAGATMNGSRSKKDDVIRYAVSSYPINNLSESIMIGDREHDILGANKVGMDSIGVLFGYGDNDELKKAGAAYIVKEMTDILNIVE